jgi:nitric oxide reductase activation protein
MAALSGATLSGLQRWTPPVSTPDKNAQMGMQEEKAKQQNFEAANTERKKQIADDSAKLLKLATDLKAEVDKTNKDTLSLNVIRKADEIEKLAHSVKEKMKLTMGPG